MTGKNRIMIYGRKDIIKEPRYCRNVERSETKETSREDDIMKVATGLFAAIAALSLISTFVVLQWTALCAARRARLWIRATIAQLRATSRVL
jgi:hypothetical protein